VNDDFLGTGWRFPILPDEAGRLPYASGEESIAHCLRALLLTGLGERVMRPDFGTRAPDLVFAPDSVQNLHDLEDSIRDAVRQFEPRVELDEVRAEVAPGPAGSSPRSVATRSDGAGLPEPSASGASATSRAPGEEGVVTVSVTYRIRRTNTRANLVFPYYLGLVRGVS
jgi:hypothetical protein